MEPSPYTPDGLENIHTIQITMETSSDARWRLCQMLRYRIEGQDLQDCIWNYIWCKKLSKSLILIKSSCNWIYSIPSHFMTLVAILESKTDTMHLSILIGQKIYIYRT